MFKTVYMETVHCLARMNKSGKEPRQIVATVICMPNMSADDGVEPRAAHELGDRLRGRRNGDMLL